jgi:hypothetical protein
VSSSRKAWSPAAAVAFCILRSSFFIPTRSQSSSVRWVCRWRVVRSVRRGAK